MKRLKKQFLLDIYCFIQLIAIFAHIITSHLFVYIFLCGFLLSNLLLVIYFKKITTNALIMLLGTTLLLLFSGLIGPAPLNQLFVSWLMGFNILFLSMLMLSRTTIKYVYWCLLAANLYVLYTAFSNSFNPEFGNEILFNKSRNYVSGTLAIFTVYYLTLCRVFDEKISLILLALLLLNSIFLYGRSGIAVSFLILIFGLYYRLGRVAFSFLSILGLTSLGVVLNFLLTETNFSEGLDTPRSALFEEYIDHISVSNYNTFFGIDLNTCCSLIAAYGNNPHNSFLMGHAVYGILSLIVLAVMVLLIIASRRLDMVLLCLFVLIRYSLDTMGVFNYYDLALFTIFYFCLLTVQNRTYLVKGKNL
ncbi:TPA: hypothetical protein OMQ57_000075 [Acinetobacter baumannii]|nr:hypothetical protein [Acinetobacter baumannii]